MNHSQDSHKQRVTASGQMHISACDERPHQNAAAYIGGNGNWRRKDLDLLNRYLPNYYSAADVFVSGSQFDGGGQSLIEAMSADVVPVVTDIPTFRVIAGNSGARWALGDEAALAGALMRICGADVQGEREQVRNQYDRMLRWDAIARRTIDEYQALVLAKQHA